MTLGLCSQLELDLAVTRVNDRHERQLKKAAKRGETLKPIDDGMPPQSQENHAADAGDDS